MCGCTTITSAKNSVLPIAAAAVMLDGETVIHKCPDLLDVRVSADIINSLDCSAIMQNGNFSVLYKESDICTIPEDLCSKMRSSILYMAPLLYRKGKAEICWPGGCNIGKRQIDIHLDGLKCMGAQVECVENKIIVTAPQGLRGTQFRLRLPSVGATQTLIMAASTAKGITVLHNCAREPEVVDMVRFLKDAGAKITGAGKGEIIIQGVPALSGVEYTPIADRILAATVLSAVNACRGAVYMKNYPAAYMSAFEKLLKPTGLKIYHLANGTLALKTFDRAVDIKTHTGYYPAFSTDMGPLLSSSLVNNNGTLLLRENIFENRFSYSHEFEKMGLNCRTDSRDYFQTAGKEIFSAHLKAEDLRAGAALVVAALARRGSFTIEGVEYIDRGYEKIENIFSSLGGNIRRETFEQ